MASTDFDMKLKKEAKTSLQVFKDQSLLRRKFGDQAVKLYNSIDSAKSASELISEIGIPEGKFVEILEFMNNNAMVSVVPVAHAVAPISHLPPPTPADETEEAALKERAGAQEETEGIEQEALDEKEAASDERGSKKGAVTRGDSPSLSPLEKLLFDKYGELGVRIYNLIDGEKTAEEILQQTGVSEAKLVEILEFMDEQGIIKLEKPVEKLPPAPAPKASDDEGKGGWGKDKESEGEEKGGEEAKEGEEEPAQEPRFKPLTEEEPEEQPFKPPPPPPKPPAEKEKVKKMQEELDEEVGAIMVDVPEMAKLSVMQRALLFAELSTKFGKAAKQLMDMVDGKRDFIDLSLATGLSFYDIDAVTAYFGKKGMLTFRQLVREDIKKKFGEDGFAIYKRFGREGLLLYEMIGKESSLKDIIVKSRIDPDRAIDILVFIHKVLGLDVPIDREVIYKQLGIRK